MKLMVPIFHPNWGMSSGCFFVRQTNTLSEWLNFEFCLKTVMFLSIITMNLKWMSASASLFLARNILPKCTAAFLPQEQAGYPGSEESGRCVVLFLLPVWTPCL